MSPDKAGRKTEGVVNLKIWRQSRGSPRGALVTYAVEGVSPEMSLLETLDLLNDRLTSSGEIPVEFESDCREGICGSCALVVNGQPHGPELGNAACQIYMRQFKSGAIITLEPWRSKAFPLIQDLVTDRSALDRIISAGGYISARSGPHPDGNTLPISKTQADTALDAGACIQCGACIAACPNGSAALFTGAQVSRFAHLPQGRPEALPRVTRMVARMDQEGFGHCTNIGECEAACPKRISIEVIAQLRREYWKAAFNSP
jgi:succinate dehydrogenase / fumarate reductase iron-sulfur subunit